MRRVVSAACRGAALTGASTLAAPGVAFEKGLPLEQQTAGLIVDGPVAGGDDPAAVGGVLPVPGRHHAARPFDDRDERDNVMGLEIGLDHEVNEARRERAIGVTVAAVAREPDLPFDPCVGGPIGVIPNQQRARRQEGRFGEGRARARMQAPGRPFRRGRLAVRGGERARARRACRRHRTARA